MKLDRNITTPRRGKYAIVQLRNTQFQPVPEHPGMVMVPESSVDYGATPDTDFFLIRLKDQFAAPALVAYADAARAFDPEYASNIDALANKSRNHPNRVMPS